MSYKHTVLKVSGMGCHSCVSHINDALLALGGVQTLEVRMREGHVAVDHDADAISVEALVQVLGEEGYDALPAST